MLFQLSLLLTSFLPRSVSAESGPSVLLGFLFLPVFYPASYLALETQAYLSVTGGSSASLRFGFSVRTCGTLLGVDSPGAVPARGWAQKKRKRKNTKK